jgi:raffinose/stachyose/melibiose transport system permease protein
VTHLLSRRERTANYVILGVFSLIALVPVLGLVLVAVHPPGSVVSGFSVPHSLSFANFTHAWHEGRFSTYLKSSLIVTLSVVALATVLSTLAGYAFGTMNFRGRTVLFYVFLLGIMVPEEAIIVPLYYDLRQVSLTDTYWGLILPQTAQSIAFGTFWMRAYFRSTPASLVEAARVDGASSWSILRRILVPGARPAILTMMVLVFMWTWNEFLLPLVMVSDENLRTAPLGLAFFQGEHAAQLGLLAAGATIVALPVVILYLFLQRRFISGMLSGAVKG